MKPRRSTPIAAAIVAAAVIVTPLVAQQPDDGAVGRRLAAIEKAQSDIAAQLQALTQRLAEMQTLLARPARAEPPTPATPASPIPLADIPLRGHADANVVVVEFTDFECPYCGLFARQVLPALTEKYVTSGKIRWGVWHLPIPELHAHALNAAETAECARGQDHFWEMHDALFRDQSKLDQASLAGQARSLGLDMTQFADCVQTSGAAKIRRQATDARALGIAVTPTFFIGRAQADGLHVQAVVVGAKDTSAFSNQIDAVLTHATAARN